MTKCENFQTSKKNGLIMTNNKREKEIERKQQLNYKQANKECGG